MEKLNFEKQDNKTANAVVQEMGENTSSVFKGEGESKESKELYGESVKYFADIIKEKFPFKKEQYTLIDIGSAGGNCLEI